MRRLSRKNQIEIGIMTLVFVIAAFFVYKTTILTRMILPRTETLVKAEEGKFQLLSDGDHIEQTFFYPSDELLSVGIRISLDEDVQEALLKEDKKRDLGTLHLKILDASDNLLMSADYAVFVLADDQNVVASFPGTQTGWENQKLTIVLDAERIHPYAAADQRRRKGYVPEYTDGGQAVSLLEILVGLWCGSGLSSFAGDLFVSCRVPLKTGEGISDCGFCACPAVSAAAAADFRSG